MIISVNNQRKVYIKTGFEKKEKLEIEIIRDRKMTEKALNQMEYHELFCQRILVVGYLFF
jgi:hypothetical protein